jgi:hypothetical protein
MWFRSLLDARLARTSRTPVSRSRCVQRVRPLLEILEDRTLLSTYTVDALTDTGTGSGHTGDLRYCLTHATSGSDTVTFAVTGAIQLQSTLPTLNSNVNIQGPGANLLTVGGAGFDVGSAADVQISGLTLSNTGTAIVNSGTATVSACTLSGNSGIVGFDGGAISNYGNLTVNNSTISGNHVQGASAWLTPTSPLSHPAGNGMGGGIYMGGGTLTINSSTLANNEAVGGSSYYPTSPTIAADGAGYGLGGGLYIAGGTVSINNSTIADNEAIGGTYNGTTNVLNSAGGGIFNAAGPSALHLYDTILADNGEGTESGFDLAGNVTSLGHNLIGNTSGGSGFVASDLLNVNPQLGPLQNNGGPTQTMALFAGSRAINAGDNTNAPSDDQRGPDFPRIVGGTIDIGAFEVQSTLPSGTYLVNSSADSNTGTGNTGTLRYCIGQADNNGGGTVTFSSALSGQTIALSNGQLNISANTLVTRLGPSSLTISGGGKSRVFDISAKTAQVSISSLTISGGSISGAGGGIFNKANLTVSDSSLSGNSGSEGGGIYNGGSVTIADGSTLSTNDARYGGGIFTIEGSSLTVNDSILSANTATHDGGGIYNYGGTVLVINSSTIGGSTTVTGVGNIAGTSGGGIYSTGGGKATVSNSSVTANTATTSGGGVYYTTASGGSLTLIGNYAISGNSPDQTHLG